MNIHCLGFNSIYGENYSVKRVPEPGCFTLILVKTEAIFYFHGAEEKVANGTIILYDEKCVQEYKSGSGVFICDWLVFDTEGDAVFPDTLDIPVNTPICYTDSVFFSGIIRNIASEFYSVSARRSKMIDTLMGTLLIKLSEACTVRTGIQPNTDPHYSILAELREKIYRNPQLKWNVDTMAADVSMSRSYFQHIYREVFGVSCISDVINGKIEKAKKMLSETSCTVSQVAAMCGYDNEEHFMRQFKKIVGVTPSAYRKKK